MDLIFQYLVTIDHRFGNQYFLIVMLGTFCRSEFRQPDKVVSFAQVAIPKFFLKRSLARNEFSSIMGVKNVINKIKTI